MNGWKITGIVATAVIVLSGPLYLIKVRRLSDSVATEPAGPTAMFVGSSRCRDCHRSEFDKWVISDHRWAMAEATQESVRGDFNNAVFRHNGSVSRFYRKKGRYFVSTRGPAGKMAEFEITHTFGWYPLQQFLVPFPGGRLQCLPIAWDVDKRRWYHLYPSQPPAPGDWLYWTNNAQNWNGMCAECHSTNLRKNYDPVNDTYQTACSEISVGCEACHGPGSAHVRWAELPDMARPQVQNAALVVQTSDLSPRRQIELCAPCHSRRMSLLDNIHQHDDFLDYGIPQLLGEGYYFADGQILEEVYVYGSFMQSKMYDRGVRCSDCHDVHSGCRIKEGNPLCLQCHRSVVYDTADHHFHKQKGEAGQPIRSAAGRVLFEVGSGAMCEQCHMPGRHYMGIDYRPDHSFRIPRPDLSLRIGTPNACNRCHMEKSARWSEEAMVKWYGRRKRSHFATIFDAGRRGKPEALTDLVQLAEDRLYPPIVRATALSLLSTYPGEQSSQALKTALEDEEALVRYNAVRFLFETKPESLVSLLGPLLYDPVKAVRMEASQRLTAVPPEKLPLSLKTVWSSALAEYRRAMERTADFAPSRHNLGNLEAALGKPDQAVENYRKAIEIDNRFYPAKVNLAMLYNDMGKNRSAEQLLREVVADQPELFEIHYSLGLLLAEEKKYAEAEIHLQIAARSLPARARIRYNLGLLQRQLGKDEAAEDSLRMALAVEPDNLEFLFALADFYLKRERWDEAEKVAERMAAAHPENPIGHRILKALEGRP
jgi:tetratricopeptide (TPR) repeat protein